MAPAAIPEAYFGVWSNATIGDYSVTTITINADGVFDGGTIWNADMSSGLVGLGYGDDTMTQQVSDELKAEVEALAEKIIAGEIEVESTR